MTHINNFINEEIEFLSQNPFLLILLILFVAIMVLWFAMNYTEGMRAERRWEQNFIPTSYNIIDKHKQQ